MSLFIAATLSLGQLCYNPDSDIYSGELLKAAKFFAAPLAKAVENKQAECWVISNREQMLEAKYLVSMDASGETMSIVE